MLLWFPCSPMDTTEINARVMCKNVGLQTHNYWSPFAILSNSHAELWTFPSLHPFTRLFKTIHITLTPPHTQKRHWQRFSRVLYTLCGFTDLAKSLPWACNHKFNADARNWVLQTAFLQFKYSRMATSFTHREAPKTTMLNRSIEQGSSFHRALAYSARRKFIFQV